MAEKLAIILSSGTVDKMLAAANLAAGAAALGKEVCVFLTFGGLLGFRKGAWKTNHSLSADLGDHAAVIRAAVQNSELPSCVEILEAAREIGQVRLFACVQTLAMLGLDLEDLEPLVTERATVSSFLEIAEGGNALFI
jgi:peroxiredoxin family protein